MMKEIGLSILATSLSIAAFAQGLDITKFKKWDEVKAKAKAENKLILVDCYTTWCGPCKMMSEKVFPEESVGAFANDKFVTVKLQFDSTAKDDEYVKANYALARQFEKDYGIAAYPSFMVFNADGEPVHRFVGAYQAPEFIEVLKKSTDEKNQFYNIVKQYTQDSTKVVNVKKLAEAANDAYVPSFANRAYTQWINLEGSKILNNKEDVLSLIENANSKDDVIFQFLMQHRNGIKDGALKTQINDKLTNVIFQEDYINDLFSSENPDWDAATKAAKAEYPTLGWDKTINTFKVTLAYYKKDTKAMLAAMKNMYANNQLLEDRVMNAIAWSMFETSDDKAALTQIGMYLGKHMPNMKDPAIIDTYANVLYKAGDKINALKWMEKAVALSDSESKSQFKETQEKMKNGTPTWE